MQIELTLTSADPTDYSARDLGFLLHKHPDHLHERETAQGRVSIFYPEVGQDRCRAVIHLSVDPVGLVRGRSDKADGLLTQYVNDRPYAANSLLSVAMSRAIGQTMAGKSKERQALADRVLPYEVRVVPVAVSGGLNVIERLFAPLGYTVDVRTLDDRGGRAIFDLRLTVAARLADILSHLYVLVPVLDNAKHYWIDADEVEKLLAKGGDWLPLHPERDMIAKRSLKHRHGLVARALDRLSEAVPDDDEDESAAPETEEVIERPIRLHDLRLDAVRDAILSSGAESVLDVGCGEGRLIRRLMKERQIKRIVGVDPSVRSLEIAGRRLHLDDAGDALRERVQLQMGSLTYGDRRWQGFDAATLVEVIEHIDPPRLSALELSLFGDAAPRVIVVTTPNREYNVLFEGMAPGTLRHRDHRFEWTREEFEVWATRVAGRYGYKVETGPLGPVDESYGAPSQMATFGRAA